MKLLLLGKISSNCVLIKILFKAATIKIEAMKEKLDH